MDIQNSLETGYQKYLESNLSIEATHNLIDVLRENGLTFEANALEVYLKKNAGVCIAKAWNDRLCSVSSSLPTNAKPGDLWFDVIELNLAVLVPNPEGISHHVMCWASTHPVYVWQYRAFLNLVRIGKKIEVFPHPDDYLTSSRIDSQASLDYVTNIYHDEAIAYSSWMRKSLIGQHELKAMRAYLAAEKLKKIIPDNLKLWESSDVEEWYRTAVGLANLDKDFSYDYGKILAEKYEELESNSDRILYQEWDHRSFIGMMTIVPVFCGLGDYSTTETYYYQLLNTVPHPSLQNANCTG
jgi:hypothetical protein